MPYGLNTIETRITMLQKRYKQKNPDVLERQTLRQQTLVMKFQLARNIFQSLLEPLQLKLLSAHFAHRYVTDSCSNHMKHNTSNYKTKQIDPSTPMSLTTTHKVTACADKRAR